MGLDLYIENTQNDVNGNPSQYWLNYPEMEETFVIASLYKDEVMVAVRGWGNEAGFKFIRNKSLPIEKDVEENLMNQKKSLYYIIKDLFEEL